MGDLAPGMLAAPNIKLERQIAEGGMGSVWAAEHLGLRTRVAVKFVLAALGGNEEAKVRFEREATAVAQIKSPHVVQVLDYGINPEGLPYIVMELLEGEDLGTRIDRDGPVALSVVSSVVSQASKALTKAHQLGIVHRDIKPENLFLTKEGDGEDVFVKVLDFGIAKRIDAQSMRMTSTGTMLGTPYYMAPEQMTSAKAVEPRSDVWALGVVAYHALTGRVPFDGETMAALALAVHSGKFERASSLVPGLPAAVDGWFSRALSIEVAARFATVRDMAEALSTIAASAPAHTTIAGVGPPRESLDSDGDVPVASGPMTTPSFSANARSTLETTGHSRTLGVGGQRRKSGAWIAGLVGLVAAIGVLVLVALYLRHEDRAASGSPAESTRPPSGGSAREAAETSALPPPRVEVVESTRPVASVEPAEPLATASSSARPVTSARSAPALAGASAKPTATAAPRNTREIPTTF